MVWSNWQGAMWRGATLVLLFGAGWAWTQTLPPPASADRIMVVHENGRSTRCRVLESWQLPDGRVAHLLQAVETGENITIVDDQPPPADVDPQGRSVRTMQKRIFAWGPGRTAPPEGSPLPPHFRIESGVTSKTEAEPPLGALPPLPSQGPVIINTAIDDSAIGGTSHLPVDNPLVVNTAPVRSNPTFFQKLLGKRPQQEHIQVVEIAHEPIQIAPAPIPVQNTPRPMPMPTGPVVTQHEPRVENKPAPVKPIFTLPEPTERQEPRAFVHPLPSNPAPEPVDENIKVIGHRTQTILTTPPLPTPREKGPIPVVAVPKPLTFPQCATQCETKPIGIPIPSESIPVQTTPNGYQIGVMPESQPKQIVQTNPLVLPQAPTEFQPFETKPKTPIITLAPKIAPKSRVPFSTAMSNNPTFSTPETKKPEPSPLAMPGTKPVDVKPIEANPIKSADSKVAIPAPPGFGQEPATKPQAVTTVEKRDGDKRDMWGNSVGTTQLPGKSLLEPSGRKTDPLMSPDRLTPSDPRFASKGGNDTRPAPVDPGKSLPPGTQSVLAARSGLQGPVTYIPVPTVTVPAPHHPPVPPPPNVPNAPGLNAYVNAFSPPPAPKGTPNMPQMQSPMQPQAQAMPPFANPALMQQMMQQQMMQQMMAQQQQMMMMQMMAQQQMPGYAQPSTGPMTNFARHYTGPQAPNPFGAQPIQPVSYAPPMMNPAQQIEALVRVLRESPYPPQREWAAQTLARFEWRANPQIVPALLQSATQDPAASVRANCVSCLGRMQAAVEPVFGTLNLLRNDIDPRVRQEVEQAFQRLGQTATMPQ